MNGIPLILKCSLQEQNQKIKFSNFYWINQALAPSLASSAASWAGALGEHFPIFTEIKRIYRVFVRFNTMEVAKPWFNLYAKTTQKPTRYPKLFIWLSSGRSLPSDSPHDIFTSNSYRSTCFSFQKILNNFINCVAFLFSKIITAFLLLWY